MKISWRLVATNRRTLLTAEEGQRREKCPFELVVTRGSRTEKLHGIGHAQL